MINADEIIAELYLKYNISPSTLKQLRIFLNKVNDYKYVYFMSETLKRKPPKRKSISGGVYLPPREYIHVKYQAVIIGIPEHGQKHKLHFHRLILTNTPINYADIQKRYAKYYNIRFELLNIDTETIKKVIEYMFKQKKKNENEQ